MVHIDFGTIWDLQSSLADTVMMKAWHRLIWALGSALLASTVKKVGYISSLRNKICPQTFQDLSPKTTKNTASEKIEDLKFNLQPVESSSRSDIGVALAVIEDHF